MIPRSSTRKLRDSGMCGVRNYRIKPEPSNEGQVVRLAQDGVTSEFLSAIRLHSRAICAMSWANSATKVEPDAYYLRCKQSLRAVCEYS